MSNRFLPYLVLGFVASLGFGYLKNLAAVLVEHHFDGVPVILVQLLLLILVVEVGIKGFFLSALSPAQHFPVAPELWPDTRQNELERSTAQLEQLGFQMLTDYTTTEPSQTTPPTSIARLFVHPQKRFFAEIGTVNEQPLFCSLSCYLAEDWTIAVTNLNDSKSLAAISHALFRLPRTMVKRQRGQSIGHLFSALASWQVQVSERLQQAPLKALDASDYFNQDANRRSQQRRRLMRRSITWCLIEMMLFSLNPKNEWLGEYKSLATAS